MPKDDNQFNYNDMPSGNDSHADQFFGSADPGDTSEFLAAYSQLNENQEGPQSYSGSSQQDTSHYNALDDDYAYSGQTAYMPQNQAYQAYDQVGPAASVPNNFMSEAARDRKRRANTALIILAILFVLVIGVIAFFFIQSNTRMKNANEGTSAMNEAISLIAASDASIIKMDQSVQDRSSLNPDTHSELKTEIPQADQSLTSAQQSLNKAKDKYSSLSAEQKNTVNALQGSIDGRKNMIAAAVPLLDAYVKQDQTIQSANELYLKILEADQKVRDAISQAKVFASGEQQRAQEAIKAAEQGKKVDESKESSANTLTAQAIVDLDNQALNSLKEAKQMLEELKAGYPELNTEIIDSYLKAKEEAINLLIETDQAIVDKKVDVAVEKVKAYNEKDQEVIGFAAQLPKTPTEFIGSASTSDLNTLLTQYNEGRKMAMDSDAVVREYQNQSINIDSTQTSAPKEPAVDAAPENADQQLQEPAPIENTEDSQPDAPTNN
ncbi:MAG: hypothetical protein Q4E22_00365 [Coriobacteriia bacterium]|nr:hypothetical protein [Coriobacteriia bacterium]